MIWVSQDSGAQSNCNESDDNIHLDRNNPALKAETIYSISAYVEAQVDEVLLTPGPVN